MSTERRLRLSAIGAFVGCGLLLILAALWWNPGEKPLESESWTDAASTATTLAEENATSAQTNSPDPNSLSDEDDAPSNPVTAEEIRMVQSKIAAARKLLHDIEANHVQPVMVRDNENWRNEHVFLPALTREQLDPVYTQLSQAIREFPAGSGGAMMCRQEAEKFLANLAKLPAKHASLNLDKKKRQMSYGLTLLSEGSTVTKGEGDSVEIVGTQISSQIAAPGDVSHLFRGEPK